MSAPGAGRRQAHAACLLVVVAPLQPARARATTTSRHAAWAWRLPGYRVVRDVALPGDTSRWDYQVYDPASHRLYIAHLGASQIVVFDTRAQRTVGTVDGIDQVHGLTLAPDLGRLYATATGRNQVAVIDNTRLTVVATASTGRFPDGLAY